ncbi:MAG: DUF2293 domain-containing protein [Opitutus sp.]|nr:DUF2293 domain-containing protein [Opitutus sp.]MCS6246744.1 DUF2293 domain-containing protein [Opitutus sp.]MCS6273294.1 DUF2293 domain-containing protein [Opitutus sp.]MCS6276168.1 DUF2293 domain-containing protein [Opitutus sp.]MCS6301262.1 DUF2293 domain-containing protein [Opitutus sp.]
MPTETREVRPFSKPGHVLAADTRVLAIPAGWALLPPGDAALSKRIKQDGPTWTVVEMKGNKRFSRGIWAPATRIAALQTERAAELQDPAYQRQLAAGRNRRAAEQVVYAEDFRAAVQAFLNFHPAFRGEAQLMAKLIADHAVPVGSGTVARTERIPIEERAEAATIAWMRHQTTGYDTMVIPLVKGRRREVRRMLAQRSVQLLARYRQGQPIEVATCPLARALAPYRPKPASPASAGAPAAAAPAQMPLAF